MKAKKRAGFTLLEVMVAVAILGLSLTALSRSHQNSIRAANRSKLMTTATMLARYKMVELEDELFEKGFSDFKQEDKGDFKKDGFDRYSYVVKVDKVELPASVNAESLANAGKEAAKTEGAGADSKSSPQSTMMSLGADILAKQMEMIRNALEQSIRRVELNVGWKEGSRAQEVTVVAYFTDPRKVDMAMGGGVVPGGVGLPGTSGVPAATGTPGASFGGMRSTTTTSPTSPLTPNSPLRSSP